MKITEVILKPKITEKALENAKSSVYGFEVNTLATKNQIKEAIEKIFEVKVANIRTSLKKGKVKRVGKKGKLKARADKKIAYIKVSSGKIDLFPKA
jgi:large subunit ribosomal protein L23